MAENNLIQLLDGEFALIARQGSDSIELLIGHTLIENQLADIPLRDSVIGPDVLALVPFRQVRERGFEFQDDSTPLSCLVIEDRIEIPRDEFLREIPERDLGLIDQEFDLNDSEYADVVSRIIENEIGRGEGANFVIRRTLSAKVTDWDLNQGLSLFRNLLSGEKGAYWTFYVQTKDVALIGASPERHISLNKGIVRMNPISGTYRLPAGHPSAEELMSSFISFLNDEKEILELMMVVDEELKMMATFCPDGGTVLGPYLKPMTHLIHTEYVLQGETALSPTDLLRGSMFAATVVGSPVENACRVIKKYEETGRGYYGAVLALIGRDEDGKPTLDAPIVIRTAQIDNEGTLTASVGATLVRSSDPVSEVMETKSKISGLLAAFKPSQQGNGSPLQDLARDNLAIARARNSRLSPFWTNLRKATATPFEGLSATLISAEDDFSKMLAHMLGSLGVQVHENNWRQPINEFGDLLILGPGPGDPLNLDIPRIAAMSEHAKKALDATVPVLGICLGHQILAKELGLQIRLKNRVFQGSQETIDFFGEPETVGFYNTFTAVMPSSGEMPGVVFSSQDDEIIAMRGPHFAGLQFHPESILTLDGEHILSTTLAHLFSN